MSKTAREWEDAAWEAMNPDGEGSCCDWDGVAGWLATRLAELEQRHEQLRTVATQALSEIDSWNEAVEKIIGRQGDLSWPLALRTALGLDAPEPG